MKTHLIFIIQAYEAQVDDILKDLTTIDIIAENGDSALERPKTLITKNYYRISSIIEKTESELCESHKT